MPAQIDPFETIFAGNETGRLFGALLSDRFDGLEKILTAVQTGQKELDAKFERRADETRAKQGEQDMVLAEHGRRLISTEGRLDAIEGREKEAQKEAKTDRRDNRGFLLGLIGCAAAAGEFLVNLFRHH